MNQNEELLCEVARCARTGAEATQQVKTRTDDAALRDELAARHERYYAISRDADNELSAIGVKPKSVGVMEQACMRMGVTADTMMDKSPTHIADLLVRGYTMGVTEITRAVHKCPEAGETAKQLAQTLLQYEQEGIEQAKRFL